MRWIRKLAGGEASTLTLRLWEFTGTAMVNLFVVILVAAYLSPLSFMVVTSLKSGDQLQDSNSPIYPAERVYSEYEGKRVPVLSVPVEGQGIQEWALINRFRQYSEFIDPQRPEQGLIRWDGNWRVLKNVYRFSLAFENYRYLWENIDFLHLAGNTLTIALISGFGVLCSSIAVAYGFSRFPLPGGNLLFYLLIATILIPESITIVPSFVLYTQVLDWNGSWYPLIVPHFFSSAVIVFLLRQNFKSIPKEMEEAAMLDGAGPLRTLIYIVLPQSVPVVATAGLLHFFYIWNELRLSSLYLGIRQDLRTIAYSVQAFPTYGYTQEMLQATALLVMIVPILAVFLAQRFFLKDMVITGLEK